MAVIRVIINLVISWFLLLGSGIVLMRIPLGSVTMVALPSLFTVIMMYIFNAFINKIKFFELQVEKYRKLLLLSFGIMVLYYGVHFVVFDYPSEYSVFANVAQSVDFLFLVCYCAMLVMCFILNTIFNKYQIKF